MSSDAPPQVTVLLQDWRAGDEAALERLLPIVFRELQAIAQARVRGEQRFNTMSASDVLNEALIKLMGAKVDWQNRAHFLAVASRTMRRVLIDHARSNLRDKRGGGAVQVTLHDDLPVQSDSELLEVDAALTKLAEIDERKAQALELYYFGGLTHDELAEALGVSTATADRDMRFARAWLKQELSS